LRNENAIGDFFDGASAQSNFAENVSDVRLNNVLGVLLRDEKTDRNSARKGEDSNRRGTHLSTKTASKIPPPTSATFVQFV
jgi:hypothetical protein